jgi:hypothetical protein
MEGNMKYGKCTQCGATDIRNVPFWGGHRDYRPIKSFSKGIKLNEYICCSCGLVETYLANMSDVEDIKEKCEQVESH